MQWQYLSSVIPQTLDELEAILLSNRQIADQALFFQPPHPFDLTLSDVGINAHQSELAVARLQTALDKQEDVLVFGDYDADGITSTAILWLTLHHLGYNARPFIPHREKHGYGLSDRALNDILAAKKPDLIVTVDNGIVAHQPVTRLNELGIDVIITDHHQPETTLPPALAIFHTTQLCGATVAWMLAKELDGEYVKTLLDLCGIATIADQVPLLSANRSFAFWGIKALQKTERMGLNELLMLAAIKPAEVNTTAINFGIAPRINAMGRLDHGMDALRLLCTTNHQRAQELVGNLNDTNIRRQDMTETMVNQALAESTLWMDEHIIIAHSPEYHEGVIGLIAGKLMEKYYKPAIVIAVGEKVAKASARSVVGVNIVELIRQVRDDLLEVGGHPMAAGFGLLPEKVEIVKKRLQAIAKEQISPELLVPSIHIECEVPFELLNEKLIKLTTQFEPFGQSNREPILAFKNLTVLDATEMGRDKKHLKLIVTADGFKPLNCIAWNKGFLVSELISGAQVDIAGVVETNEWKGKKSVQMKVRDVMVLN